LGQAGALQICGAKHMRGRELSFIVEGRYPYLLYYGTVGLFVIGLLWYGHDVVKNLLALFAKKKHF